MLNPILRVVFIVAGTACYLGLAVLGWGGISGFFSHDALVAVVVIQIVAAIAAHFAGGNLSTGVKEDRANRWVLPVFGVLFLLLGWLPPWTDSRDILSLDHETIRWVGIGVFIVGNYYRLWPVYVLGHRFSGLVAIQPDHTLVTDGIYRVVRNPSYLGLLLIALGWSLTFRSIAGLVLIALIVPPLIARMNAEERLLHDRFGAEYDAYRDRTWRLLPGLY